MAAEPAALYSPESPALRLVEATGVQESEDILGYRFIHKSEERNFDLGALAQLPTAYLHGLGRAATHLLHYHLGDTTGAPWPYPQRQEFKVDGRTLDAHVSEANPELNLRPGEVTTHFIGLGLGEKPAIGSSYAWHVANATGFPGRRIVTLSAPGESTLEEKAAEDFVVMRHIAGDSPVYIVTNSLSTKRGFVAAHINLLARGELQMDVRGVKSFAPAMGARNVPETERFSEANGDDMEFIQGETNKFFRHVPGNILHEVLAHPEAGGVSTALVWAYAAAAALGKLPEQLAALAGNVKSAQAGIDWEIMKHVATSNKLDVVAGANDPLWQAQRAQFLALRKHAPDTQIRELEGYGHVLTIDGPGMVQHMYEMEEADAA